jgi:hypothetical protein
MTKIVICLTGAALVLAIAFGGVVTVAALPRPTTLAQQFPDLAAVSETKAVAVGIQWVGLSTLSPMIADYLLELHDDQFTGQGRFQVAQAPSVTRAIAVPRDVVRAFLIVASKVPMVEGTYTARIEHTDDYPSLEFGVETKQGPLRIGSQSQDNWAKSGTTVDRTPWRISYLNRTFVVTASDLDQAFEALEPYLQDVKILEELSKEVMESRHGR